MNGVMPSGIVEFKKFLRDEEDIISERVSDPSSKIIVALVFKILQSRLCDIYEDVSDEIASKHDQTREFAHGDLIEPE